MPILQCPAGAPSALPSVTIPLPARFSPDQIFDCGQCFRFDPDPAGGFSGVALGRFVRFFCPAPGKLTAEGVTEEEFNRLWRHYLALDTDYEELAARLLSRCPAGSVMDAASRFGAGIRILRQEPFETLISFILSQNNNIPRIKGLVAALCRAAGEPLPGGQFAFPAPAAICALGEDGLRALRMGFRAGYVLDAARWVEQGTLDLSAVAAAPPPDAAAMLEQVRGVGPKVAACTLLFGFGRMDAFPVDVWVRRAFARYFGGSFDIAAFGDTAGLAQQYLFYYERYHGEARD